MTILKLRQSMMFTTASEIVRNLELILFCNLFSFRLSHLLGVERAKSEVKNPIIHHYCL